MSASVPYAPRERLRMLLEQHPGDTLPLAVCALLLSAEEQGVDAVDVAGSLAALDALAVGAASSDAATTPLVSRLARLNHRLFVEAGFGGDTETYDAPENSYLDRVLARRRGLPILLSVVLIEVGRRVGLDLVGVGFPSHFLVRPRETEAFFVDPFHGGAILRPDQLRLGLLRLGRGAPVSEQTWAEAVAPVDTRRILLRMNLNLKHSFLRRDQLAAAARASERILLLAPELAEERRDLGRLRVALGDVEGAVAELAHYLAERPLAPDAWTIAQEIARLQRHPGG